MLLSEQDLKKLNDIVDRLNTMFDERKEKMDNGYSNQAVCMYKQARGNCSKELTEALTNFGITATKLTVALENLTKEMKKLSDTIGWKGNGTIKVPEELKDLSKFNLAYATDTCEVDAWNGKK